MVPSIRFRKSGHVEPVKIQTFEPKQDEISKGSKFSMAFKKGVGIEKKLGTKRKAKVWRCIDSLCWMIGFACTTWWLLLFLIQFLPATLPGFQVPESPGTRLKREGLSANHPVVFVPGIITGGLELWEGKPCADGLFRKRVWGGSFSEIIFKRTLCWLEHLTLDNETGLDPPGIRVRAVPGLVAADYFSPGYFIWAVLIENLAKIGYDDKNMYMAAYDWRLAFQNTEMRDGSLSSLKSKIELMYVTNGHKKVVVLPHSMGVLYFLHFLKWVETPPPMGGGGGPGWCAKHIKAIVNIGPTFLGVPKTITNLLSAEAKNVAYLRSIDPGVLESEFFRLHQTLEHLMRVGRSWDSVLSLMPKGGETVWGGLDWSPEEGYDCGLSKKKKFNIADKTTNISDVNGGFQIKEPIKYGRIISFGKAASQLPSLQLPSVDSKEFPQPSSMNFKSFCKEVLTEFDEMSRESITEIAEGGAYTAASILPLLRFVAPKLMKRAEAHFSFGIADDVDDPKYAHYKYWSNPLETKLPDAPDMEIYCLYGVGVPTERSYIYKQAPPRCNTIPFRIDTSVNDEENCVQNGVYLADGDDSVPVISSGFMCAKAWKGRTRFNPSGMQSYVREYLHKPPTSFLEGRGIESGVHVDILGNVALIEDVMRVAAGASGAEIGGDRIHSDILRMSEKINLQL